MLYVLTTKGSFYDFAFNFYSAIEWSLLTNKYCGGNAETDEKLDCNLQYRGSVRPFEWADKYIEWNIFSAVCRLNWRPCDLHMGITACWFNLLDTHCCLCLCLFTKLLTAILQPKFGSLYPLLFPEVWLTSLLQTKFPNGSFM